MLDSIRKNGLLLAIFALICTFIVSLTSYLTKDAIAHQRQLQLERSLNQVIPTRYYNNQLTGNCVLVTNQQYLGSTEPKHVYRALFNGSPVAAVIETTAPDGYSGNIDLLVAVTIEGEVIGVRTLAHQETPGLGDKIEIIKSDWINSLAGHHIEGTDDRRWAVKKDGGMFDQFTGATITPRAVVKSVKNTLMWFEQNQQDIFNQASQCEAH